MKPSNWWMYHGDSAHTGLVTGSDISSANVAKLKVLHDIPIPGPVLSVPALVDGYVYVGLANSLELPGSNGGTFMKINAKSGVIEKKFEWPTSAAEGDTHGFTGMGCTPAVVNGKIYFSAFNGKLYCLDQNTLKPVWITDLRNNDPAHGQPVSNTLVWNAGDPPAAGWSSPLVVNGKVYVGMGEGENPALFGFVFCLDAETGNVIWIYCTCQFFLNVPNQPNVLPPSVVPITPPSIFTVAAGNPSVRGCSVWSSIAYDPGLNRIYCATGNPSPDSVLPTNGFSNGILSLDASTGAYKGFFQAPPESSYRATDNDVDFGGSPMLFTLNGRTVVCAGCKNGGFFVLDADSLKLLVPPRQLLPYYNDGTQIPTVDPHVPASDSDLDPHVPNRESDEVDQENYSGTYSTPALHPELGRLFIGVGGNNYHNVQAGIDFTTTPFLRALDWNTLKDAWEMDDSNPRRYLHAQPPMYTFPGESGLSSPAVVNDLVFCSTSIVAVYAFDAKTGKMLWQDVLGEQTGGFNGGYGYCLGPAISGNYVVAGGLVFGRRGGGVLRIYTLP
jgi:outer membrane protein assembly factor BamB